MQISSFQNTKIKQLIKLQQKSRDRKKNGLFVVEGLQENQLALQNGFVAVQWYICPEIYGNNTIPITGEIFYVTQEVFDKIAYRNTTGGIVGVYKSVDYSLEDISKNNPVIVVLEAVEKPGNLGAILRSCDAANVDAVVICDRRVDFYNPNVIRSSVGTVFTKTIISTDKETFVAYCNENNVQILATFLRDDTQSIFKSQLKTATALVFGTESTGLSDFWLNHATKTIKIPMLGQVDSLNVSNAVSICAYEVVRQRSV